MGILDWKKEYNRTDRIKVAVYFFQSVFGGIAKIAATYTYVTKSYDGFFVQEKSQDTSGPHTGVE